MIAHKLLSAGQLLVVQLDEGQAVWCQPGRFVWKTPNVSVQARMIGSGGDVGGMLDRALATAISAGRRRLSGNAAALPYFQSTTSSGLVAFAGEPGGPVHELRLEQGRNWLVTRGSLVAAERTVGLALAPAARPGQRQPGQRQPGQPQQGIPEVLERLDGTGSAFVSGAGGVIELDLSRYGGAIEVDPLRLIGIQEGIRVEPRRKALAGDELLALLLGGGRPSLATLTGEGTVLLRSVVVTPDNPKPATRQGESNGLSE
jgi:uncharacterized protein (AIM24 family)